MLHSSALTVLSKSALVATGLAMIAAMPTLANASTANPFASTGPSTGPSTFKSQLQSLNALSASNIDLSIKPLAGMPEQGWLMADKDDKKGRDRDDDDRDDHDRYEDNRILRVDLNRAKNLARQAAEAANGGIRVYRAENSMHGPASQCPYVDQGNSWVFTFLGGRAGSTTMTIESVVTVYKYSPRVVVAYNGPIRRVQQTQSVTQFVSFTSSQRTVLVDLLRGNCSCNSLLSNTVRTQVISQARSLPPGIQKKLLRGKGLPPGIAKKWVRLPKKVNSYINVPTNYDLVVIGSNLLVVDQINYVVIDLISNVL